MNMTVDILIAFRSLCSVLLDIAFDKTNSSKFILQNSLRCYLGKLEPTITFRSVQIGDVTGIGYSRKICQLSAVMENK